MGSKQSLGHNFIIYDELSFNMACGLGEAGCLAFTSLLVGFPTAHCNRDRKSHRLFTLSSSQLGYNEIQSRKLTAQTAIEKGLLSMRFAWETSGPPCSSTKGSVGSMVNTEVIDIS